MPDVLTILLALGALSALTSKPAAVDVGVPRKKLPNYALDRPTVQGGLIYDPALDWDYAANERRMEGTVWDASVPMIPDGVTMIHEGIYYFWYEDRWYENFASFPS